MGEETPPLVVVVTPTYNGARFLRETLEAVQAQTWPNLLHLVLDNASTDATPAILAEYAAGPSGEPPAGRRVPVTVVRNASTLPQRSNWNEAVRLVPDEARYIRLLCDDDTITPDCIAESVRAAESDPQVVVVGCMHEVEGEVFDPNWADDVFILDGREAVRRILIGDGFIVPPQMMWRKSASDLQRPIFDETSILTAWDVDGALALTLKGKFAFVRKSLGVERVHANTITSKLNVRGTRSWTRDALELLRKYGPEVMGADYPRELRRLRRHYVRRIIVWRREPGAQSWLDMHKQALARAGWRWGPGLIADAIAGWALQRLGLQRAWNGFPGTQ